MTRFQLEHIIRAAAASANVREIVVIGSQAILGSFPHPPERLQQSMDADVYPKDRPELSIVIDGAIGELSIFHSTFGYYAHGVGEETAILPLGWEGRLVKVENENTFGAIGWCLEVHDLAVSKLLAGRDKDVDFVGVMMGAGMVKVSILKGQCLSPFPTSQSRRGDAGVYHAGGMKAISRRLRSDATTPPVCQAGTACIPEGC